MARFFHVFAIGRRTPTKIYNSTRQPQVLHHNWRREDIGSREGMGDGIKPCRTPPPKTKRFHGARHEIPEKNTRRDAPSESPGATRLQDKILESIHVVIRVGGQYHSGAENVENQVLSHRSRMRPAHHLGLRRKEAKKGWDFFFVRLSSHFLSIGPRPAC